MAAQAKKQTKAQARKRAPARRAGAKGRPQGRPQGRPGAKQGAKQGGGVALRFAKYGLVVILLLMLVFATPVFVILAAGIVPTLTAAFVDRDPDKNTTIAVGTLNLAGISPYVVKMLSGPMTLDRAIDQLMQVYTWLVMYGAAGAGWLFIVILPPITGAYLNALANGRIQHLRRGQRRLIELWGEEVAGQSQRPQN